MMTLQKLKYKEILYIFIPLFLQQLITNIINIVDNVMVGRFSDIFISSISIVNRVFSISNGLLTGLVAACAIFIAQYNGAKDIKNVRKIFGFSLSSSLLLLFPFIVAGLLFPRVLIGIFSNNSEILANGEIYIRYLSLSMIPYVVSQSISNALRSIGVVKQPLYITLIAVICKIILNYIFLYSPFHFGLQGAGVALLLSRIIEVALYLFLLRINEYPFRISSGVLFKISKNQAIKVMKKMLPLGINEFLFGIGVAILYRGYTSYSIEIASGYAIAYTYYELFRVLFGTIGMTMNVFVLPHLGTSNYKQAQQSVKSVFKMGMLLSIGCGLLLFGVSYTVPFIYNGTRVSLEVAQNIIKLMAIMFPLTTLHNLFYFIFRCGGEIRNILLTDSLFILFFVIPIQYCLINVFNFNVYQALICTELTYIVKIIITTYLVHKGTWMRNLAHSSE